MLLPADLDLGALFLAVLGSSFHCTGMCGGFVLAGCAGGRVEAQEISSSSWSRVLLNQMLYHVGKGMTYVFLGTVAGHLGASLLRSGAWASRSLSILGALLFLWAGLGALGVTGRVRWPHSIRSVGRAFAVLGWRPLALGLVSLRSPLAPLYLGTFSGLLPCPLVYAFAVNAASRGSLAAGAAVMSILELGTLPALLGLALVGRSVPPALRTCFVRASGVLFLLLGLWTCYRGWAEPDCCGRAGF